MKGDLISREALKKAITINREIDRNAVCYVLDIIDNTPTADPGYWDGHVDGFLQAEKLYARPIGEWKFCEGVTTQGSYKCSLCDYRNYHKMRFNYCPNCGGFMRGGKE